MLTGIARSIGSSSVITVQGYHAALFAAELFLIPAAILAIILIKRGLTRNDLGIPGTGEA